MGRDSGSQWFWSTEGENQSEILILVLFHSYSAVSSASSAQLSTFGRSEGKRPPGTSWLTLLEGLFDQVLKSPMRAGVPRRRSAFAPRHETVIFFFPSFCLIHLLQEQAFGAMTCSLKRVLGDSPRRRDNKALSGQFGGELIDAGVSAGVTAERARERERDESMGVKDVEWRFGCSQSTLRHFDL